jgi:hypothetical protein
MKPKWMEKKIEGTRAKSDKVVKKIAKKTGGYVTCNSGATPLSKGDISYADKLVEHKMTSKDSFKLDKEILFKIYYEATKSGKEAYLMIDFGDIKLIGIVQKGE